MCSFVDFDNNPEHMWESYYDPGGTQERIVNRTKAQRPTPDGPSSEQARARLRRRGHWGVSPIPLRGKSPGALMMRTQQSTQPGLRASPRGSMSDMVLQAKRLAGLLSGKRQRGSTTCTELQSVLKLRPVVLAKRPKLPETQAVEHLLSSARGRFGAHFRAASQGLRSFFVGFVPAFCFDFF